MPRRGRSTASVRFPCGGYDMAIVQEFSYQAVDSASGVAVKGTLEAASEASVVAKLKAQGLMPLNVTLMSKTGLQRDIKLPSLSGTVSPSVFAVFKLIESSNLASRPASRL